MKTEDILAFENNAGGEIHLVKDRLFWQAWERSAYLFVHNLKGYKVRYRFVQKVMMDLVYIGFPSVALKGFCEQSIHKGLSVKNESDDHIVISGLKNLDDFDLWKQKVVASDKNEKALPGNAMVSSKKGSAKKKSDYYLFRISYDFSVYVLNLIPKFNKIFRFSIGSRICSEILDFVEMMNLFVNHERFIDKNELTKIILNLRIRFRLSNDLKQIGLKQWLFVNSKLEEMLSIISPESMRSRMHGDGLEESSTPPTIVNNEGFTPDSGFDNIF